jgi:outer membrane receptor protein involved in Fe transport
MRIVQAARAGALALLSSYAVAAQAGGLQTLEPVEVLARGLVGAADSATEGTITATQLGPRPLLRPGEVLETVPGLIVTQHSGDGKANQFFMRGFNLDHGTDFATAVLGVPVNLPTHAHGQGYSDLNFLIPELIATVRYRKGPYAVEQGDFAAAGAASIEYLRALAAPFAELGFGENGFRRALAAASSRVGPGHLLLAAERYENDGPWDIPQGYRKRNGVLRLSSGDERDGFDVSLLAYDARWTATDQIARRAVDAGIVGRFGTLDATSGGDTARIALSSQWARRTADGATRANLYAVDYRLDLYSNFTYFLTDPVNGDQFEQVDRRRYYGGGLSHTWSLGRGATASRLTMGASVRHDDIDHAGLRLTRARQRLTTIRADRVRQSAAALYAAADVPWTDWLRTVVGVRADGQRVEVDSDTPANSGGRTAHLLTPKLAAVFGPFAHTEFYAAYGHGFHSNDARGATIRVNPDPRDPGFGAPAERVPLLVRAKGTELGVRSGAIAGLQTSLALWRLALGSELVFVGDAGTTEASRPSRRQGVEFANYWTPRRGLTVDADFAYSRARFRDPDPAGDRIPGAIERTASLGAVFDAGGRFFGGARLRYFGPRPLIEDDSVRSASSTLVNAKLGWRFARGLEVSAEVLNLFDRKVNDIEYFYESQLAGEPAPVADIHFHPAEPRTVRLTLRARL